MFQNSNNPCLDEYGADALRFMLLTGISAGSDIRYQEEKIIAARNFANKFWNAARFIFMSLGQIENEGIDIKKIDVKNEESLLGTEDRWMIESIHRAMDYMKNNMDKYEIALAGQKIYDLIWNEYCDWYIEVIKGRIFGSDTADKAVAISVAIECMANMLKLRIDINFDNIKVCLISDLLQYWRHRSTWRTPWRPKIKC